MSASRLDSGQVARAHHPPRLPGAHRIVRRRAHDVAIFWYAWRGGGPQIATFAGATLAEARGAEAKGAAELARNYAEAQRGGQPMDNLAGLCIAFEDSADFKALRTRTQTEYSRLLKQIRHDDIVGDLSLRALQARGVRALFLEWRDQWADTPRKADVMIGITKRVLSWAFDRELIAKNPLRGVGALYASNRADVIWTEEEIDAVCRLLPSDAALAVRFMRLTGFRRGDAVRVLWSEWDQQKRLLVRRTEKGRRRGATFVAKQVVAITPRLSALLAEIPCRGPTILTRPNGHVWDEHYLTKLFRKAARGAGVSSNKRLHDLRGTTATEEMAEMMKHQDFQKRMGWAPGDGAIAKVYVDAENVATMLSENRLRERDG